jgi:GTPase SAR1 family protein
MARGSERHMFAGGNTPTGFYSYYQYIAPAASERIFIIKGGPGVGKSTLMRRIGQEMQDRGYDIEYFHCSADNQSLDGVRIPALAVALIDGTAPHVVDPKNPGAVDEIINLGEFWEEREIRAHKHDILTLGARISRLYRRAYRFLAAAKYVYDDVEALNQEGFNAGRANEMAAALIAGIFGLRPVSSAVGHMRRLFAGAITAEGPVHYLASLTDSCERKYVVSGSPGTGKSTLVEKVVTAAVERGYDVEAFHCPFAPEKIEHAVIPALRTAVITSTPPHIYSPPAAQTINMDACRAATRHAEVEATEEQMQLFHQLFQQAVGYLRQAKALHDQLETYYAPHMNFAGVEAARQKLMARILAEAERFSPPVTR